MNFCQCGCGQECNKRFVRGHSSRVFNGMRGKNSWNKNKKVTHKVECRCIFCKAKRKDGSFTPWNIGLTKETDERVRKWRRRVV